MNSTFKNGHLLNSTYFSSTREVVLDTRVTAGSEGVRVAWWGGILSSLKSI